jgi:serine/threonine protein kinase
MTNDPLAMTEDRTGIVSAEDSRLMDISREYLRALEAGDRPRREDYIARHPELREMVVECLDGIDLAFSLQKGTRRAESVSRIHSDQNSLEPLGDFRIIREIGRGGMGIVYEAFQMSLARNVALKVLPFASALDERHRKRFLLEAQSAAQLHHANIVPVYAVGCDRGTHYYAMQLIDGRPISTDVFDDLCEPKESASDRAVVDLGASTGNVHRDLTSRLSKPSFAGSLRAQRRDRNRTIAELIAQAADALDYAHACGIVHRDIKPGNLLLDLQGKLWITDFGLAQIAAGDQMTQTGDLLGTLRYMSPEQASGHRGVIDHRSDVYSLGATLYEMLTRRPVFDGANRQELLHQILNNEPVPPRKIERSIPEELEVITLKALRQSASDRYESAQAFADDLRRYLNESPILARRPTWIDQARKWMRRHPSTVLSILFALLAAVVSLAVVTFTVTQQKKLTTDALVSEQRRAVQAETRLAIAQSAADEMIRMAENELSISPMEEALRQRLLSSAIKYYQSLIEQTTDDAEMQDRLKVTQNRAEDILNQLSFDQNERQMRLLKDSMVQRDLGITSEEAEARQLTPEQKVRLKQISLQLQGPPGLRDAVVAGKLKLSSEQFLAIQTDIVRFVTSNQAAISAEVVSPRFLAEQFPNFVEQVTNPSNSDSIQSPEDLISPQIKAALMEVILKRLTPEQLKRWEELAGPKFVGQ